MRPLSSPMSRWMLTLLLPMLLCLSACTSLNARQADTDIPADAQASTRVESNGDAITEYRVAGQLRAVKVVPSRGPTYYLYDRNGDGRVDNDNEVSPVYFKLFKW